MTTTHEIGTDSFTGVDRYDGDYEDEEHNEEGDDDLAYDTMRDNDSFELSQMVNELIEKARKLRYFKLFGDEMIAQDVLSNLLFDLRLKIVRAEVITEGFTDIRFAKIESLFMMNYGYIGLEELSEDIKKWIEEQKNRGEKDEKPI